MRRQTIGNFFVEAAKNTPPRIAQFTRLGLERDPTRRQVAVLGREPNMMEV